uniref:Beta-hexosaminidase n=1 Tax=Arcella intermedia TaxID=1963864 RepID=A0A6B2L145_9EUKA
MDLISFSVSAPPSLVPLVEAAEGAFLETLRKIAPKDAGQGAPLQVALQINSPQCDLLIGLDESYTLSITSQPPSARITAETFFGMRHALETLSQLIIHDAPTRTLRIISTAHISDRPSFTYRGVLLDTSRQFYPLPFLHKLIEAMSYNKLNYFHWHISDTSSFSYESLALPNVTKEGVFEGGMVYLQEEIQELVFYGKSRGVRVLPEFDAPSHAGNGWGWGEGAGLGNLAVCINQEPWTAYCIEPPCGQLNPVNPNIYDVLGKLYQEMYSVFGTPEMFHMGGDEVMVACWNSTQEIVNWMLEHNRNLTNIDYLNLWGQFQQQAYAEFSKFTSTPPTAILWTSELVNHPNIMKNYINPSDYIIQVWENSETNTVPDLLNEGFRLITSNWDAWYMDCGVGGWVDSGSNWCSPYKEWQLMYSNKPYESLSGTWKITDPEQRKLLIGGESCLWSEEADAHSMEVRIWPRAAALAERLWSDPSTSWREADDRMQYHRQRLVDRGINADALQPLWCLYNQGKCTLPQSKRKIGAKAKPRDKSYL